MGLDGRVVSLHCTVLVDEEYHGLVRSWLTRRIMGLGDSQLWRGT